MRFREAGSEQFEAIPDDRQREVCAMRRSIPLTVCWLTMWATAGIAVWATPAAAQDPADAIVGQWQTEPKSTGFATVRIVRKGQEYHGEIIALSEPTYPVSEGESWFGKQKVDRNNPKADQRDRPIVGLRMVWGFTYRGGKRWEGGRIYDPENGKTYKAKIKLNDDGTLDVRGFVGFSLLGRTTTWRPVARTP